MVLAWLSLTTLLLGYALVQTPGLSSLGVFMLTLGISTGFANLFHNDFLVNPISARFFWLLFGMCTFAYFAGPDVPEPEPAV